MASFLWIALLLSCEKDQVSAGAEAEFATGQLSKRAKNSDEIYQVSTLEALAAGQFDGKVPYSRLKNLGDFGVGTFDHLDGEMVALDGEYFKVKTDGIAYPVQPTDKAPFADVTFFEADRSIDLQEKLTYEQLIEFLGDQLPDPNGYYAIRIQGKFQTLTTRSVPQQEKPYPTLGDAIAQQTVFNYEQMEGTMVGTYLPAAVGTGGVIGFHFHFISKDRTRGGHLLNCTIDEVEIGIDDSDGLTFLQGNKSAR